MSNQPDIKKRAKVRKILLTPEGQSASDREVSRMAKVSRTLVEGVRRQMIMAGEHPAVSMRPTNGWSDNETERIYRAGDKVRGGYVYDENGKVILATEWAERVKEKPSLAGKPLKPRKK